MKLYIKNMVCNRCKTAVKEVLAHNGIEPITVDLGEVEVKQVPSNEKLIKISDELKHLGFEVIDDKKSRIIEKIKNVIVKLVHYSEEDKPFNLSTQISAELHYEYNYLSTLFSEVEGTTIEKYFIAQKIERVKELIVYNELTLSEIAYKMGYSSVAHLSSQFKKVTGFTPTHFRNIKENKRKSLDEV
ncbi:AraC family transcriptional regulator [Danxiaibacter flavus]|uniref:AraC family transcriptional regulator n=1 Tax=Danxiaibacter flavus TaxID=3049108 RepID=A0ABV3ZLP5_9BACT|nr:AraC family transcriptional regulator [Chitinophagaceae bacterium DXS]